MPLYLFKSAEGFAAAMRSTSRRALEHGRFGWQVTDCVVTLTDVGYSPGRRPAVEARPDADRARLPEAHAARPRQALDRAGVRVCEPVLRVLLEVPTATRPRSSAW